LESKIRLLLSSDRIKIINRHIWLKMKYIKRKLNNLIPCYAWLEVLDIHPQAVFNFDLLSDVKCSQIQLDASLP
jgi:hypothetical protein